MNETQERKLQKHLHVKDTQDRRILKHLHMYNTIDPLRAWQLLGIYRLSAVIHRLRKVGYNIVTERMKVQNQFGESCSVANYRLEN